jgi:hypothetical protein
MAFEPRVHRVDSRRALPRATRRSSPWPRELEARAVPPGSRAPWSRVSRGASTGGTFEPSTGPHLGTGFDNKLRVVLTESIAFTAGPRPGQDPDLADSTYVPTRTHDMLINI